MCAAKGKRIKLGELLVRAGVITENQLRAALAEQKKWGGKLGYLLVEMGFLDEETLVKALSKHLGLPRVDFKKIAVQPQALEKIDAVYAEKHQVLPLAFDTNRGQLVVAMSDPADVALIDEVSFKTGCKIRVAITGEKILDRAIRHFYHGKKLSSEMDNYVPDSPMKVIDSQGHTVVRDLKDIYAEEGKEDTAQPLPSGNIASEVRELDDGVTNFEERIAQLESVNKKQRIQMKALVELLVKKGYISLDELRLRIG
jgi:hypothetical protein